MAEKFVVFVAAPPEGEAEAAGRKLAGLLKLDPLKVEALLRRLPDVVTRPVNEREAEIAAKRFRQAGLEADVRPAPGARPAAPPPAEEPAERTPFSSAPVAGEAEPSAAGRITWADEPERTEPAAGSTFGAMDDAPLAVPEDDFSSAGASDAGGFGSGALGSAASAPLAADEPAGRATRFGDGPAARATRADSTEAAMQQTAVVDRTEPAAAPARPARDRRAARAEAAADGASAAAPRARRRGSLRSKLLSTAIIPVLLAIAGALAATWFTARPALYDQLLESARNPAIATAATLSSTLERAGGDEIDHLQLLETILITRQAFARQNLSFILATDTEGNPYSGSFLGGSSFPDESLELQNAVRERAVHAVAQGGSGRTGWAEEGATSTVPAAGGQSIEIVAQPLMSGNTAVGAVVVGVTDQAVTQQVNAIVINVLLFSLLPLLLAILIAVFRARRLTNNVLTLTQKADEISRGDLDEPVELHSNDELDDLSAALERMRVSMSGALERLRRRR